MDIDKRKLKIVGNFAKRMLDANDIKCNFVMTEDLKTAVKDAGFVRFCAVTNTGGKIRGQD